LIAARSGKTTYRIGERLGPSQIQLRGVCYDSARLKGDILNVARDSQKRVQNILNLPMT
jgi:hypothetical protein